MSPERVSVGGIPCRRTENRKGAGTNSGEFGARNLEAESIRRRVGGGVCETCNMNTITRHVYLINKEVCVCVCMPSIINNGV